MDSSRFKVLFFIAITPALSVCYAARATSENSFSERGDPLRNALPRPPGGLNDECSFQIGPLNWPCEEGLKCIRSTSAPGNREPAASNSGTCQMIMEGYTISGLGPCESLLISPLLLTGLIYWKWNGQLLVDIVYDIWVQWLLISTDALDCGSDRTLCALCLHFHWSCRFANLLRGGNIRGDSGWPGRSLSHRGRVWVRNFASHS